MEIRGHFDKELPMEFYEDLVTLLRDATVKGANTIRFNLPKTPEIEMIPDVEVTITWRVINET